MQLDEDDPLKKKIILKKFFLRENFADIIWYVHVHTYARVKTIKRPLSLNESLSRQGPWVAHGWVGDTTRRLRL